MAYVGKVTQLQTFSGNMQMLLMNSGSLRTSGGHLPHVLCCGAMSNNNIQRIWLPTKGECSLDVHKFSKLKGWLQGTPMEALRSIRSRPESCGLRFRQGAHVTTVCNCVSTLTLNGGCSKQTSSSSTVENDLIIRNTSDFGSFVDASKAGNVVPVWQTIDLHLSGEQASRCMANRTNRPSEIFVEVEPSRNAGMYTVLTAPPCVEIVAESVHVTFLEHKFNSGREAADEKTMRTDITTEDPIMDVLQVAAAWQPAMKVLTGSPQQQIPKSVFCGGWVDLLMRRSEEWYDGCLVAKLYSDPVRHMGLIDEVVVIDHNASVVHMVHWVRVDDFATHALAYHDAVVHLQHLSTGLIHAARSNSSISGSFN